MDEFNLHYGSYDAATGKKMVSAPTQSLVTSIINAGEFIGAATAFLISERIGLRGGLLASCVIVAIGTTLQVAVPDVGCLIQWWQQSTNHTVVGVLGWLIEL